MVRAVEKRLARGGARLVGIDGDPRDMVRDRPHAVRGVAYRARDFADRAMLLARGLRDRPRRRLHLADRSRDVSGAIDRLGRRPLDRLGQAGDLLATNRAARRVEELSS
jgi:hypothetical protein